jgi:hypothetical protein
MVDKRTYRFNYHFACGQVFDHVVGFGKVECRDEKGTGEDDEQDE